MDRTKVSMVNKELTIADNHPLRKDVLNMVNLVTATTPEQSALELKHIISRHKTI